MRWLASILVLFIATACDQASRFEQLIAESADFNLAILNGTVVDGSGSPGREADVLVRDGKIVFIGKIQPEQINATHSIDASGKVVSPGFIDVHTHGNPLSNTSFENFIASGVTTIFLGQDGYHPSLHDKAYDLSAWMDSLDSKPLLLNVAMLTGHGSLRRQAGIVDESEPGADEISRMTQLLEQAMQAGAYGLSTGLEYVPGMYASKEELMALAGVLGEKEGIMASHMRNEDEDAIEASLEELITLGSLCKVHASHLKVVYGKGHERGKEILSILEDAKDSIRLSADVYPYTASYTGIGILFPKWAKTQAQFEVALKTRKQELIDYLERRVAKRNGPGATLFGSGLYSAKTLEKAAADEGISFAELLLKIGPQGASGAYFIMNQQLQDVFINHPEIMIASDGSPTMLHPRGHGTQARIFEQYVMAGTLPLETAIYKMTGLPAATFGLEKRGLIKEGYSADLLVFDPDLVREKATYANPYQLSEGFDQVIVNGTLVRNGEKSTGSTSGQLLRKKP